MKAPLFLTGYARSGTTLLRSMLEQHPDIRLSNEPELVFAFYKLGHTIHSHFDPEQIPSLLEAVRNVSPLTRTHLEGIPEAELKDALSRKDRTSFQELFEALLPKSASHAVWGEKGLNQIFYMQDLVTLYPDSLFLTLVRDPRAVVLSKAVKKKTKGEGRETTSQDAAAFLPTDEWFVYFSVQALRWKAWMETLEELAKNPFLKQHLLTVSFESLVKSPELVLQTICDGLGVPFEPAMLVSENRKGDRILAVRTKYAHANLANDLDSSRIEPFLNLDPSLIWTLQRLLGEKLSDWGYASIPLSLSVTQQSKLEDRLLKFDSVIQNGVRPYLLNRTAS